MTIKRIGISKIYLFVIKGYQYYGESGQDTNTKLFEKVLWSKKKL